MGPTSQITTNLCLNERDREFAHHHARRIYDGALSPCYSLNQHCFVFSCDQAFLLMVQSVCPSVCPSVENLDFYWIALGCTTIAPILHKICTKNGFMHSTLIFLEMITNEMCRNYLVFPTRKSGIVWGPIEWIYLTPLTNWCIDSMTPCVIQRFEWLSPVHQWFMFFRIHIVL